MNLSLVLTLGKQEWLILKKEPWIFKVGKTCSCSRLSVDVSLLHSCLCLLPYLKCDLFLSV